MQKPYSVWISFCFWATELDLGLSSTKSFSSSIYRQRARYFCFKLDILCELESPAHSDSHNRARFPFIPLCANRARFLFLALGCKSSSNRTLSSSANSDSQFSVEGRVETPFKFISPVKNKRNPCSRLLLQEQVKLRSKVNFSCPFLLIY